MIFVCTVGVVAAAAAPAGAQDQALEQAKQQFDEGQNLYLQGKYIEAAERFLGAYAIKAFPAFLFNVAVCYEKNRDFARALELYERYLKEDPHSPDRALVLQRITAIRGHLNPPATQATSRPATVTEPPPTLPPIKTKGLVVIESKPEGAAIYLGDKTRGIFTRTPYTGSLPPGSQTVIIETRGYSTERKTFQVRTDRMVYLYFSLSVETKLGWIEVKASVPAASVFVDTKRVGAVGLTPYSGWLRPGKHRIFVEREGYQPVEREVTIVAGDVHAVDATLRPVEHGWLKVTGRTTEGARVKVDGKPVACSGTPCRTQLSPGTYQVEVERQGFKRYREKLTIARAVETQLAVKLNPKPSRVKAYVSFGVSSVLLAGAITSAVMCKDREDSLREDLAAGKVFDSGDPRILEGKVTSIVANSLFALSGAVGALGLYYMFRNEGPDSYGELRSNRISVSPLLGPGQAALTTRVEF